MAIFYKELKAAGMTDEQAFELTKQYMSTLNIGGMFSNFAGGGSNGAVKIVGKEIVGDDK